jgi:ribosome-binding protein aMBF1 (putative translation factor)
MAAKKRRGIDCRRVELDGVRYVIVREALFEWLCRTAGVEQEGRAGEDRLAEAALDLDRTSLAGKLARRRRACGLSQAELARRAGVRAETLNRIERGHTTPDFATVRKLVVAMNAAEDENVAQEQDNPDSSGKEPNHADQP